MCQFVALCCNMLQRVAVICSVLQRLTRNQTPILGSWPRVYVSVLQCVAACCSVLWYFGTVDEDAKTYFGQQVSNVFRFLAFECIVLQCVAV